MPNAFHTIVIIKSKKHYRFFEANAGAASCKHLDSFHTIFNGYFTHKTIFDKYSREIEGVESKEEEKPKAITFELLKVFNKIPKKK